jgi:Domain of unknown function (DUF6438)
MTIRSLVPILPVTLLGCASMAAEQGGPPPRPIPIEADSISYEASPCFGVCPVYKVTVRPDGTGLFEGRLNTAVTGERRFTLTRDQYRAFAAQLEPLHPRSRSVRLAGENCSMVATDMPSVEVTWTSQIGSSESYYLYYGCDMEKNAAAAERLRAAPALLPIAELIGQRR